MAREHAEPEIRLSWLAGRVLPASLVLLATLALANVSSAATALAPPSIAAAGSITFCSDMTGPPLEFLTPDGQPVGSDIDIGNAIAARFGVKAVWRNVPFAGIIPTLLAEHCDAIISQLFDKPARRKVIDMVDYMDSSEALLVPAGNPEKIHSLEDLSGHKVAVENGTTILALIQAQNEKFAAAGKKPAEIVVYPKDTDALLALEAHQVDVYGTTLETGAYYMHKSPHGFEVAGPPFHRILTAIGLRKNDVGMESAIQKVVAEMQKDGTILAILKKWGLEGDMLK